MTSTLPDGLPSPVPDCTDRRLDEQTVKVFMAEWLGVPDQWWIEPTTLFSQTAIPTWGTGIMDLWLPTIDEFWAWVKRPDEQRSMHGVKRRDGSWHVAKFNNLKGQGTAAEARQLTLLGRQATGSPTREPRHACNTVQVEIDVSACSVFLS